MATPYGKIDWDRVDLIDETYPAFSDEATRNGIRDFIRLKYCQLAVWAEQGSRALGLGFLGNMWARGRVASGCYTDPPPGFLKEPPPGGFSGGQCVGTAYQVEVAYQREDGPPAQAFVNCTGPVEGLDIRPHPTVSGGRELGVVARAANLTPAFYSVSFAPAGVSWLSQSIVDVVATSGPDNCGDPPGFEPVYPPGEELTGPVPSPGDRLGGPETIRVEIDLNGVPTPFDVDVTAPEFLGPDGVRFCINGTCYVLGPDDRIWEDGPRTPNDDLGPQVGEDETLKGIDESLDEIKDLLEVEISGEVEYPTCDPEVSLTAPYSGLGLLGVQSMLNALTVVSGDRVNLFCEEDGEVQYVRVMEDTVGPAGAREYFDVPVDPDAKFVDVYCNTSFRPYAVSGDSSPEVSPPQGRYAQVSILESQAGGPVVVRTYQQYYSLQRYQVPGMVSGVPVVRISLYPGAEAEVYSLIEV